VLDVLVEVELEVVELEDVVVVELIVVEVEVVVEEEVLVLEEVGVEVVVGRRPVVEVVEDDVLVEVELEVAELEDAVVVEVGCVVCEARVVELVLVLVDVGAAMVVAVVLVVFGSRLGVVVDVVGISGSSLVTSSTNASMTSSIAGASPVTKQSPLASSRRNAALNLLLHRERHATTLGSVGSRRLRDAFAAQRSLQAPLLPASLNFPAAQVLARSDTFRRLSRSAATASTVCSMAI
jgi:hypothetical protein